MDHFRRALLMSSTRPRGNSCLTGHSTSDWGWSVVTHTPARHICDHSHSFIIITIHGKIECSKYILHFLDFHFSKKIACFIRASNLGAVHNCQHLCIRTERTEGGGGHETSVVIFKC